jgi:glycosyltransferase involved in cell wall biosynthesis
MRKIAIINQDTGYLFIDIANACTEFFDDVTLITGKVTPLAMPLKPGVTVIQIPEYRRTSLTSRAVSWIFGGLATLWIAMTRLRGVPLLISSNPPVATLIPLLLRRKSALVILDIYPEALATSEFVRASNPIYRLWRFLNKAAYPRCTALFTLTNGMSKILAEYTATERIHLVPAWPCHFELSTGEQQTNKFRESNQLDKQFLVVYSGNLGKEYELEALLYIALCLKEESSIKFVIAGKGWKHDILQGLIDRLRLPNVLLLPPQSPEMYLSLLTAMDLGVVAQNTASAKVCIPSKTYNLLPFGKPILCIGEPDSDLGRLIDDLDIGKAFKASEPAQAANFVSGLRTNPEAYQRHSQQCCMAATRFSRENARRISELTAQSFGYRTSDGEPGMKSEIDTER